MALFFAGFAAFVHYYVFALESLLWGKPRTRKVFVMDEITSKANELMAFNQGFYNLFLALGATVGLLLYNGEFATVGKTLVIFTMSSMVGASLVLIYSEPKLVKPAAVQGIPPFLAILFVFLV